MHRAGVVLVGFAMACGRDSTADRSSATAPAQGPVAVPNAPVVAPTDASSPSPEIRVAWRQRKTARLRISIQLDARGEGSEPCNLSLEAHVGIVLGPTDNDANGFETAGLVIDHYEPRPARPSPSCVGLAVERLEDMLGRLEVGDGFLGGDARPSDHASVRAALRAVSPTVQLPPEPDPNALTGLAWAQVFQPWADPRFKVPIGTDGSFHDGQVTQDRHVRGTVACPSSKGVANTCIDVRSHTRLIGASIDEHDVTLIAEVPGLWPHRFELVQHVSMEGRAPFLTSRLEVVFEYAA